ncbi:CPA2 family monovalent cation:H+ antiporter-2 [Novosphingobium hassiacum]|uniref:CPA2 family monovalent cation:H+ antiporter-2 n=2 Tax=Novosphingobium hassiacum TaxID=173676 RepID=A0A7W5ZYL0_9SPHN|nr:CPA2 family monovalent cation:H+ antiporter-2 [Novosphingobium hassiacum]
MHHSPLIATIVAGVVFAFLMGALAHRLKASPIVGYVMAGVIVGPYSPGFVADAGLANELAEIGVILLMFGVGLHFSLKDLLSVRRIAIPGAIVQIVVATMMGMVLAWVMDWNMLGGFVFGLSLSVASTVVLLRALQGRKLVETEKGRIAVGWLIVEDLVMVLALVMLPVFATVINGADRGIGFSALVAPLAITLLKVVAFVVLMLLVGRRAIPAALHWVAHTGSRELFRLAVLAIALGVAFGAAYAFDVSFALGAFFAGMILGETPLSRRATEETLPLRDAFAVLFFVSVGMLFNPAVVIEQPLPLLATIMIIVIGKSVAAFAIVRAFGYPGSTALTVAASLAQIGEFSFILAALGSDLGILPPEARDLILAGAIISIITNPLIFSLIFRQRRGAATPDVPAILEVSGHVIVIGYGRVGRSIAEELAVQGKAFVVIEDDIERVREAEAKGYKVLAGNGIETRVLEAAALEDAGALLIAIPEGFEAGAIFQHVRKIKPDIPVIARAHSDAEVAHLKRLGVSDVVTGVQEIATRMLGVSDRGRAGTEE